MALLGKKIRKIRKDRGYSQERFAYDMSMDRADYGGIERGEFNVASLNLIRIAEALDTKVGSLFPTQTELKRARKLK